MCEIPPVDDFAFTGAGAGWMSRMLPTVAFYFRILRVVFNSRKESVAGVYDDERWQISSLQTIEALERTGIALRVEGRRRLTALQGPCVFVGNHMSTMETFILPCLLRQWLPFTYVVKESLMRYPIFRDVLRTRDPIVVTRTNPRQDLVTVLREGEAKLKQGVSIIVFPQTTRTRRFDPALFNSIGAKLAKRAGTPVVPMAIKTDAWGTDGWPIKDLGRIDPRREVRFDFGDPINPGKNDREANLQVVAFIADRLRSWGVEVAK